MPSSEFKMEMEANETDGEKAKKALQKAGEPASKAYPRYWYIGHCLCNLVILEQNWYWWASNLFRIQDEKISLDTYYSASTAKQDTQP